MDRSELETYVRETQPNPEEVITKLYNMPENAKADTERNERGVVEAAVYGVTFPQQWMQTLVLVAQAKNVGLHALLPQELEKLMSRDQMVEAANAENVTLAEIKRRLMVKAFPCLPKWNWPVRSAGKTTPKVGAPSFKQKSVAIKERPPTYIDGFTLPPDIFLEVKELAMARAEMPTEYIKRVIIDNMRKRIASKEKDNGSQGNVS